MLSSDLKILAGVIGKKLSEQSLKITVAESCTGGGMAFLLTSIPGSSQWFDRGFVTYSNAAKKEMLNVSEHSLKKVGAVSGEVAREMADGALNQSDADISISITGIAGPEGGTSEKPVGTVWIGWASAGKKTETKLFHFEGDREKIREKSIEAAFIHLQEFLK